MALRAIAEASPSLLTPHSAPLTLHHHPHLSLSALTHTHTHTNTHTHTHTHTLTLTLVLTLTACGCHHHQPQARASGYVRMSRLRHSTASRRAVRLRAVRHSRLWRRQMRRVTPLPSDHWRPMWSCVQVVWRVIELHVRCAKLVSHSGATPGATRRGGAPAYTAAWVPAQVRQASPPIYG